MHSHDPISKGANTYVSVLVLKTMGPVDVQSISMDTKSYRTMKSAPDHDTQPPASPNYNVEVLQDGWC